MDRLFLYLIMMLFLITFVVWAILHSITAAFPTKRFVRHYIGEAAYDGLYRLGYNLFAIITFLPLLYVLMVAVPQTAVWNIPAPYSHLFLAIRWTGMIGLLVSLLQTDLWDFAGLRQAGHYFWGDDSTVPASRLVVKGTYGWVRHPLYSFSMMMIWFSPIMTLNGLIFNLLVSVYFWIGATYEEKRLEAEFGQDYVIYKQNVSAFFPMKLLKRA